MSGVFGGDRKWLAVFVTMFLWGRVKSLFGFADPQPVYIREAEPGDVLVVAHEEDRSTRRKRLKQQKKDAKEQAKADAKAAEKAAKRQAKQDRKYLRAAAKNSRRSARGRGEQDRDDRRADGPAQGSTSKQAAAV